MKSIRFRIALQFLALTALLLPSVSASAQQSSAVDIRVWTESTDGKPLYDVCYQLVGYSNVGCDENRDGNVYFEAIPYGEYELVATNQDENGYNIHPMRILVDAANTDFLVVVDPGSVQPEQPGTTDVHLITRDPATGDALLDACYELVGYSNIGCDENQDGHITFQDIPFGDYTIRQTTTPAGYDPMGDYDVRIDGGPDGNFSPVQILLSQGDDQAPDNHINMSVVFYDPYYGAPIPMEDNCAQLWHEENPASNVGCDEDIVDGQVDFMHVEFDGSDADFALEVSVACPYGVVPNTDFQMHWYGEKNLGVFVAVSPDAAVGCQ